MCGIYGQVRFKDAPNGDSCLRRLSMISHRGPDHEGRFFEGNVFLGHARLSILDPVPAAHQPFGSGSQRLVYNGEIYNFLALRSEIKDATWNTRSDTEILYRLLQHQGISCLSKLNGMFAFAYWDEQTQSLLLARDRAGIKPLYYRLDDEGVEFASEIKAFEQKPDRLENVKEILARGFVGQGALPFPDVQELEPGFFLEVNAKTGKAKPGSFASLPKTVNVERMRALQNPSRWESELERHLETSVHLHLQSDAPLGSLCSGGIDSTLISALALKRRKDMPLYHCGVEGSGGEEEFAHQAAKHLGVDLIIERMRPETFWELLPEVTWHLDLPVYHPNDMSLHLISRRAHKDGIKVLLCGEGADELFGGYSWHADLMRLMKGRSRLAGLGNTAERAWKKLRTLLDFGLGKPNFTLDETSRFAAAGLCYPSPGVDRIYKGYAFFSENFKAWKRWDEALNLYSGAVPKEDVPVQALLLDNMQGHLRSILHRTDRILMANSIEGRVPFLENNLFDFALNLPLAAKIQGSTGKKVLKAVARKHLPSSIVDRPKMGFPVPWERYLPEKPALIENGFVSEWTGLNRDQLHAFHSGDPVLRFRLIALEVWGRIFVFGEKHDSIRVR